MQVRKTDTVARLGGDEFVMLFEGLGNDPGIARQAALVLAETCRAAVATPYKLDLPGMPDWQISISIGVALFLGEERPVSLILEEADRGLYAAKRAGRNTIRFC